MSIDTGTVLAILVNDVEVVEIMVEGRRWKISSEYHDGLGWLWAWRRPSREVHALHDLVNWVRLQNIDLTVREVLNVDADLVVKGPLIFHIKLGYDLHDRLVNCCFVWGGRYAVVHVEDKDDYLRLLYFISFIYADNDTIHCSSGDLSSHLSLVHIFLYLLSANVINLSLSMLSPSFHLSFFCWM